MIELPLDNTPSKEFSVNTPVGVLRFRAQWDSFLGQWYMDILSPTGETWLNRVALTAGVDNLLAGCGVPELRDCALFAIDTKDVGVRANATITAATDIYYQLSSGRVNNEGLILWGNADSFTGRIIFDAESSTSFSCSGSEFCRKGLDGTLIYNKHIGSSLSYMARSICVSGDYVWVGGDKATDYFGNYGNLRKYTKDGTFVACFDKTNPGSVYALCGDSSGNIYAAGSNGNQVAKYNSSGVSQWSYNHGADLLGVCVNSSGDVFVTGNSGTGTKTTRKLNSSGSAVWSIDHTASTKAIAVDSSSNVYIVGDQSPVGLYMFRKYNSSGTLQWSKTNGAYLFGLGRSVVVDADDNIWIGTEEPTLSGGSTMFKYDGSGSVIFSREFGPVNAIAIDNTGGAFFSADTVRTAKQIKIGDVVYSFKSVYVWPLSLSAYEVQVENNNADTINNFVNAINGTGSGFGSGTLPHPDVFATAWHPYGNPSVALITARATGKQWNAVTLWQNADPDSAFQMIKFGNVSLEYGNDHGGNNKLDLYNDIGKTYRVFMSFPGDTVINPFTTTF